MDAPQRETESKRDGGDLLSGFAMSPEHEPYRPSRASRWFRATVSVGGGVLYLFINAVAAFVIGSRGGLGVGLLLWFAATLVTFRWYARDVSLDVDRDATARFKRGAWFALPLIAGPLALMWIASYNPPVFRALKSQLTEITLVGATLAPLAFGIGAVTRK
jgi:hypothetical protein